MQQFTKYCEWCDEPFQTEFETKTYCSRAHKERAREKRKRIAQSLRNNSFCKIFSITCVVCENLFTGKTFDSKYCSTECKQFYKQQKNRDRERNHNTKNKGIRAKLFFRDKGLCQICLTPIEIHRAYPDPLSLSIDHIMPLSRGGTSAMYNLQISHLKCNLEKRDLVSYKYQHNLYTEAL